jgi:hypothetical protein
MLMVVLLILGSCLSAIHLDYQIKNINLSLGIGAMDDAQDVRLNLRVPMAIM